MGSLLGRPVAGVLTVGVLVIGCSAGPAADAQRPREGPVATPSAGAGPPGPVPTASPSTSVAPEPATSAAPDPATSAAPDPTAGTGGTCEAGPGRAVTPLLSVDAPAVTLPEVRTADVVVDGERVAGAVLPTAEIAAQLVDAGCVVRYDAPGGCLGAVEISAATIPERTVPERVLPELVLPDGTALDAVVLPRVRAAQVSGAAVRVEQTCQVSVAEPTGDLATRAGGSVGEVGEPGSANGGSDDAVVLAVTRPGLSRPSLVQHSVTQPSAVREQEVVRDTVVEGVVLEGAVLETVVVPGEVVDAAVLEGYPLPGAPEVQVLVDTAAGTRSYVGPATSAGWAAGAAEVATDITAGAASAPEAAIVVEGHTDDAGTEQQARDRSRRAAAAVVDQLVERGVDRARITVEGLGATAPRAGNDTDDGRAQNRRVVVTVPS